MKRFFLLVLACVSFLFGEQVYSDKVLSLYFDKNDAKPVGRLLPTNAFEVLKTEGDKVLLKISGFVKPAAPSVL